MQLLIKEAFPLKYWLGYLVAAIFAAISIALSQFAKAHQVLVDMIYPYISRLAVSTLADWTAGGGCVWQTLLIIAVLIVIAIVALILFLRWNPIRCLGWVLAAVSCVFMLNTGLYGLNAYASPLADDMNLSITDYTVSELSEATVYFRDQANALATQITRHGKGKADFGSFEDMAVQAADGFRALTYEDAISVFSGSTVPVKKQGLFASKGNSGVTVALTGEAAVNPKVPTVSLPFAMCKEMAHRMCIYADTDANFTAFLAASRNESVNFQYSAYLMAYYYCYQSLSNIPTSTAKACAQQADDGVSQLLRTDLESCDDFYKHAKDTRVRKTNLTEETAEEAAQDPTDETAAAITFSSYNSTTDLLASWYIQEYILPLHQDKDAVFDPLDASQVDLTGLVNAPSEQ